MSLFGFASGLPLLLTNSTLQAWMKDSHVDLGLASLLLGAFLGGLLMLMRYDRWQMPDEVVSPES